MSARSHRFRTQSPYNPRPAHQQQAATNFGSNQDRIAQINSAQNAGPQPDQQTAANDAPKLNITRTLRVNSKGEDVKALQAFLGLTGNEADGHFEQGTKTKVMAWQKANGLTADGVVGKRTVAAMNGIKLLYGHSQHHDEKKFVPSFPMTAYHESGSYRTKNDPYAVGAVTNPKKKDDLGGKTYGVYQFETFVHEGGDTKSAAAKGSTAMRFARWEKNPFGKQLLPVAEQKGVASAEFDALWKKLATKHNKAFGKAQQDFLRHDKGKKVITWMKRAQLSNTVQADDGFFDLVLGTLNQLGSANSMADHIAAEQKREGRKYTVNEAAQMLIDQKIVSIPTRFRRSPGAHAGVRNRYKAEKKAFK